MADNTNLPIFKIQFESSGLEEIQQKLEEIQNADIDPFEKMRQSLLLTAQATEKMKQQFGIDSNQFREAEQALLKVKAVAESMAQGLKDDLKEANKQVELMRIYFGDGSVEMQRAVEMADQLKARLSGAADIDTIDVEKLKDGIRDAGTGADQLKGKANQATGELKKTGGEAENLKKKLKETGEVPLDKPVNTLKKEFKLAYDEASRLSVELGKAEDALRELEVSGKATPEQLKQATNRVKELEAAFGSAAKRTAQLKADMQKFNRTVSDFNPDNKLQALVSIGRAAVGAVQGVAGAMTLVGVNAEDTQKTIAKLQALMAFSDALNSIDDIKDSWKNLNTIIQSSTVLQKANVVVTNLAAGAMRLFGVSVNTASTSFKVLKGAIAATGIGALVLLIGEAISYFQKLGSAAENAAEKQKEALETALKLADAGKKAVFDDINRDADRDIARLEAAGATEKQIFEKEQYWQRLRILEISKHVQEVKGLNNLGLAANEAVAEAEKELADANNKLLVDKYKFESDQREKALDKQKEQDEKRAQLMKQSAEKLKAQLDREKEIYLKHQEELNEIIKQGNENSIKARLDDRGKDLFDSNAEFEEQQQKLKENYDEDVRILKNQLSAKVISQEEFNKRSEELGEKNREATNAITLDKYLRDLEISKRYNQEIADFIDGFQSSEYLKQRDKLIKDFDEKIKIADAKQKELLEKMKNEKVEDLDRQETLRKDIIVAETKVTTVTNSIQDSDTPEERKDKLEQIFQAEREVRLLKEEQELIDFENLEAEKQRIYDKYMQLRMGVESVEDLDNINAKEEAELLAIDTKLAKKANIEAKHRKDEKDADEKHKNELKSIDDAKLQSKLATANAIGSAIGQLGGLFKKNSVAAKAAALTEIAIGTGTGFINALDIAQKSAKATGPGAAFAFPIFYATQLAAVLGAASRAKAILSSSDSGGSGSSSAPQAPTVQAPIVQAQNTQATQPVEVRPAEGTDTIFKTYISDSDLQTNEEKRNFLNKINHW